MHEVSLVRGLITQMLAVVHPQMPEDIWQVSVCMGPLSGVEPLLVQQAFEEIKATRGLANCTLVIEEVPLKAVCCDCRHDFLVESFNFICPKCHSGKVRVTQGDDFRLLRLEVACSQRVTMVP